MRRFTDLTKLKRTFESLEDRRMLIAVPFSAPISIDEPEIDEPTGIFAADLDNDGVDELIVQATTVSGFREVTGFHIYRESEGNYQLQRSFSDTSPTVADFDRPNPASLRLGYGSGCPVVRRQNPHPIGRAAAPGARIRRGNAGQKANHHR